MQAEIDAVRDPPDTEDEAEPIRVDDAGEGGGEAIEMEPDLEESQQRKSSKNRSATRLIARGRMMMRPQQTKPARERDGEGEDEYE